MVVFGMFIVCGISAGASSMLKLNFLFGLSAFIFITDHYIIFYILNWRISMRNSQWMHNPYIHTCQALVR